MVEKKEAKKRNLVAGKANVTYQEGNEDTMLQTSCSDYCRDFPKVTFVMTSWEKHRQAEKSQKAQLPQGYIQYTASIQRTKGEDLRECCLTNSYIK